MNKLGSGFLDCVDSARADTFSPSYASALLFGQSPWVMALCPGRSDCMPS